MDQPDKAVDSPDSEDIPSDFFDDFSKEEFVKGLSVVDSWDDGDKDKNTERPLDSEEPNVENDEQSSGQPRHNDQSREEKSSENKVNNKLRPHTSSQRRSASNSKLDHYIKPGSRRDPTKTNEAIRRDKEVKVKEYLAKHLDSTDDIRPPGTELDDFYNVEKPLKKTKTVEPEVFKKSYRSRSRENKNCEQRFSPKQRSTKYDDYSKYSNRSLNRSPRHSPRRYKSRNWQPSPLKSKRRYSPYHQNYRHYSPRKSRRSRSRDHIYNYRPRRSSPVPQDNFLYPNVTEPSVYAPDKPFNLDPSSSYIGNPSSTCISVPINEFSIPGSSYIQGQVYTGGFSNYSGYMAQPTMPDSHLGTVPAMNQVSVPLMNQSQHPFIAPASSVVSPTITAMQQYQVDKKSPYDALAQLVADGKLSQEDYLKLAPNTGGTLVMDDKTRVMVLGQCDEAITKLASLILPNHLLINENALDLLPKSITPKFCSPLKRQQAMEFQFTKAPSSLAPRQNKLLLDSIIACIGLNKRNPKIKTRRKGMRDASVQTEKPYCDICEIRESNQVHEIGTSIEAEYITSTVHTQVVEQDLIKSKSFFNISGSVGVSEPISIAHLTSAQLVSQLAARAKSLKQSETVQSQNQFARRNPPNNYEDRGSGGRKYQYNQYY